ncbi:MAG: phenylalanine--tRNA ligase subunit beta [Candidatus Levybacteria bacterium]|nr:phenylalanine--tRNA ligase subunit beta [Candidatus Levybacteria bacterium]
MNILIPNSWLKEFLETDATPQQFADAMSLTSVSIEHMDKIGDDTVYDIEVTTNRPDLMSIQGIAREASAVLPEAGFKAIFKPHKLLTASTTAKSPLITIESDPKLVNRIVAVVMDIELGNSPEILKERLEKTGIRSLNNVVDVTNYIMREVGHPSHVFDYDRLTTRQLHIRASKRGERIKTLDEKEFELSGGDIVADDGTGTIVDLLGIMGTANSVVTDNTKRILLFLDNNNPHLLRKTSMNLGIRTEAAVLNEKGADPELMLPTLLRGIELLEKYAKGKVISEIIDIYPNKPQQKSVIVSFAKITSLIGINIPEKTVVSILENLGFSIKKNNGRSIEVIPPSTRLNDIEIPEDIIEEIARVYGYQKIPNLLPCSTSQSFYHQSQDQFYWIERIKTALCLWGFNEIYTYSMVSEELFDGPVEDAVKLTNPLTEDHVYLRNSLTPSVIATTYYNKTRGEQKLFEIANVYIKKSSGLPDENLRLAVLIKKDGVTFYDAKGIVEQLLSILGIIEFSFTKKVDGIDGAVLVIQGTDIGQIEIGEDVTFEIDLGKLLPFASDRKIYKEPAKYPPIIEDVRIEISTVYTFSEIEKAIKDASSLVHGVALLDVYKNKKTFRINFLDRTKNLTNEDIEPVRRAIFKTLEKNFSAKIG